MSTDAPHAVTSPRWRHRCRVTWSYRSDKCRRDAYSRFVDKTTATQALCVYFCFMLENSTGQLLPCTVGHYCYNRSTVASRHYWLSVIQVSTS